MIQLRRGTSIQRLASDEKLHEGQPFYETDTNRLYVGDNVTSLKDLIAVNNNILNDVNDSVILKYSGTVDTEHYQSKALGESEALLGEANKDTVSSKRNLVAGKLNVVRNSNIIAGGLRNDVSGVHSFVTGDNNTIGIHGGASRACGSVNYLNAYTSSVDGDNNDLSKNTAGLKDIHIQGRYNVSDYNDTNLYGLGLRASKDNQTLVGRYNAYAQDTTSTFVVGIGTDNPTRKTGLRVKDNGNVEAPNANPSADKDLITKLYANNNYVKLVTGTGTNKAYIHTSSGTEGTTTMAESAAAWTLAYRGAGGTFQVGTPKADSDVATKSYVDLAKDAAEAYTYSKLNIDNKDASTLASAKSYTDTLISSSITTVLNKAV